jgi:hypothetical protein
MILKILVLFQWWKEPHYKPHHNAIEPLSETRIWKSYDNTGYKKWLEFPFWVKATLLRASRSIQVAHT